MQKAEAQRKRASGRNDVQRSRGIPKDSSQVVVVTQPETLAQALPLAGQLARINDSPRMATQRQAAREIQQSPRVTGQRQRLAGLADAAAQRKAAEEESVPAQPAQRMEAAPKPNRTGLPDTLKRGVETLSGMSMDAVRVHYNSDKPAQLSALAYAQGTDIHVAPGQERHLPHEAWHVVQQAQGRVSPTRQMKGGMAVNDDAGLELEADVMGRTADDIASRRGPAGGIASPGMSAGLALDPQAVRHAAAPVQMVPRTWTEADLVLNQVLRHYGTMFRLLSDKGGKNRSTWANILERMNDMIDLQRQSERRQAGLQQLGRLAQECQQLVDQWNEKHPTEPFFGTDAWTAKTAALNTLEPLLDALSPSSGGLLAVQVPHSVSVPANSMAAAVPRAQSGIDKALTAEENCFRETRQAIAADRSRLIGKTKTREHVQVDTSKHLLAYANALAGLGRKITDARASGDSVGDTLIAAVQRRKTSLFEDAGILEATDWQLQVPESYRLIFPDESRSHEQRVAAIRNALGELNEVLHPRKTKRGGVGEVAGEAAGDPLSMGLSVFGF